MKTTTALLTNHAYGYPSRGAGRRVKPTVLACLHQTANHASAMDERNYANRAGSPGPSATVYIDRDGGVVRALDPVACAAWSQGDVQRPDTTIPTVKAIVSHLATRNANEWVYESIECCGTGSDPYTAAQAESVAQLVAAASRAMGVPVNRSTVLVHRDLNTVSRGSDPWAPAIREAHIAAIITRANTILHPPVTGWHTVSPGETLGVIAAHAGITLAKLLAFPQNAAYRANPALIHPGDRVRVK